MRRHLSFFLALLASLPAGCSLVTDFDKSRLARPDSGEVCGLDGGLSCDAVCNNGIMEPGETCDPPDTCPTSCDDGTACTDDTLVGEAARCNVACQSEEIALCQNADQCCASVCSAATDSDCSTSCGNGVVEPGETCDPTSLCPDNCNDGNACTVDSTSGSLANCNFTCTYQLITRCIDDDECCPTGCDSTNDADCTASCGNSAVEPGETCDPPDSCPTSCDDGNVCTINAITGSSQNCNVACTSQVITQCLSGDGCCPGGCDANTDHDCTTTCDNEVIEPGETCDPPGSCPTSCNDGTACTLDTITGSAANCTAACRHQQVTQCQSNDGCCPAGCNAKNDNDCTKTCNNSVVEPGETCDPPTSCMTNCNDGSACTIDTLTGSAANCTAACSHQTITQCTSGDGCCPPGCNNNRDGDCSVSCDNGVIETGETCDPRATCPATAAACNDGNACTVDALTGSATSCTATCTHQRITQCQSNDGCCPAGCNANNDNNCSASCGNGVVEGGETCDPQSSCPTSCNDGNSCTIDTITGSAMNCNVACARQTISTCTNGDGCCPGGCNANNDNNCSASCGNSVVETGETCDPPGSCPTTASCNDGNACTVDSLTGSAANCTATCSRVTISQCTNGDACCPAGCNANNDNNCSASCGNSVMEAGETCDPPGSCPTTASCNDGNACTVDSLTGSAANCTATCSRVTISQCTNGDACCPGGCNANNDNNCSASCGNSVMEAGETCDPPGSCPTTASCNDGNACTVDSLTGSAANCTATCSRVTISQCTNGDACCPAGCNANNDNNCSASCGNSVMEAGETCDPPGSCPTTASCNDGNACTVDSLTGSAANCTATCSRVTISQCANGDACCPAGCNANSDNDCSASCGNGVVEGGETCDPVSSCPATCADDGDPCTMDVLGGSAAMCNATCTHPAIPGCVPDAGPDGG